MDKWILHFSCLLYTSYDLWNQDTYLRFFEASTDNGFDKDYNVADINSGDLTASFARTAELWATSYQKIIKCNNFLENIDLSLIHI